MRAVVLRNGQLEVRETPDPVPGPGELLVRTVSTAICASDVHFIDHHDGCVDRTQGACDCGADVIAAQDNGEVAHCCSAAGIPTSMAAS